MQQKSICGHVEKSEPFIVSAPDYVWELDVSQVACKDIDELKHLCFCEQIVDLVQQLLAIGQKEWKILLTRVRIDE